ncbi:MAG: DUF2914 domain-containing protein [Candidatus Margulisbacteria bacterium]|nr:DUF2914 domain-containing protein [Candidatus Margulisiibacteriota bacterium]
MKPFVGYTRRPEPKWPYILIAAIVVLILLVMVVLGNIIVALRYSAPTKKPIKVSSTIIAAPSSSTASLTSSTFLTTVTVKKNDLPASSSTTIKPVKEEKKETVPPGEIKVENIFFTSKIDGANQPTNRLDKVAIGSVSRLYCYTKIISQPPQTIHHLWVRPDGEIMGEVTLYITNNPAYTWSYIGLGEPQAGKYRVLVKDRAGKTLAEKSIELTR